jgi:hypothetical protein
MTEHNAGAPGDWPFLVSQEDSPQVGGQMRQLLEPIAEREGLQLEMYSVGQPFPFDLTGLPPGGGYQYNYRADAHTLTLGLPAPSAREVRDVESAPVEFALTVDGPAIYLLFRFAGWPWNYCAYTWHLLEDDPRARVLPPAPKRLVARAIARTHGGD